MFNLTTLPIGGLLGSEKFTLAPDRSEVVTPTPDQAGGRMYQCRFYCQVGDQVKIFNDTRWPLAISARVCLFFIPDPARGLIGYLSFREYAPFPSEGVERSDTTRGAQAARPWSMNGASKRA